MHIEPSPQNPMAVNTQIFENADNQILECDFAFKCPKQWENLNRLDHPDQRFCDSCNRKVFFVHTRQQLAVYQKQGHCIAANVNEPDVGRSKGIMLVGGAVPKPGALEIHMFGEQGDVDNLMVVLDQVQRNKPNAT